MKLALGTVQFGLDYGINNTEGKPSREKVFGILNKAYDLGIKDLDTADLYGDALEVLKEYKSTHTRQFHIMSKFIMGEVSESIGSHLDRSLSRLQMPSMYAYFFHRFNDYKHYKGLAEERKKLIDAGLVKKIGVSIYSDKELEMVVEDPSVDIIQLPFNIFDSAPEKMNLLKKIKNKGKEVHIRSLFLQGMFYKDPETLTGNLTAFKQALKDFHTLRLEENLSVESVCFGFANSFDCIDALVIGVDNIEQLEKNVSWANSEISPELKNKLMDIKNFNKGLLNPSKWEK